MRAYALTAAAGDRASSPPATLVAKSPDRRERRSAFTPIIENIVIPGILQKSSSRSERRAAVAATVSAILGNIAAPKQADAEKATAERPIIRPPGAPPAVDQKPSRRRFLRVLIVVAIFATLAQRVWRGEGPFAPPAPTADVAEKLANAPRLSMVILPFANLSGDPGQDYIANGLTDDLTTDLSHLPDSFIVAHSAALTDRGKPVDAKKLGRRLGVRYALEGSVRQVGEKITVNAQLISTETGADVWADRFEGERSRLGELQAEIDSRIANALGVKLPRTIQKD
jgi:adenylate cyclase